MSSKWRHFTKAARREQFEDLMENRFRRDVRVMGDAELADTLAFCAAKLAATHARFIYVRQRLEFKLGTLRAETLRRA
jgi:hypothetical protein